MKVSLICHPAAPSAAVSSVTCAIERSAERVSVEYRVHAAPDTLRVPTIRATRRVDELWRHTCAELFVALPNDDAYLEFNFSPSAEWAAYDFEAYRLGMRIAAVAAPVITSEYSAEQFMVRVDLTLPAKLASAAQLQVAPCMVIEDASGACSYWALAHGAERPDFHRLDGFTLSL